MTAIRPGDTVRVDGRAFGDSTRPSRFGIWTVAEVTAEAVVVAHPGGERISVPPDHVTPVGPPAGGEK